MSSVELAKEIVFGGACGLCAGYVSKKFGSKFIAGAATAAFMGLRYAIFDGHHLANWSPLDKDDASYGSYLFRKARRETTKGSKRFETFCKDNIFVVSGFAGGLILSSA